MEPLIELVPPLSFRDSVLVVVGAGLVTHLIFNRTETHKPLHLTVLLGAVPGGLGTLFIQHGTSVPVSLALSFSVFLGTLLTSILIYRLSPWHPLARYPGPIINRISRIPLAYQSLKGKQHKYYYALHQQYGDVVRNGPNELSFRNVNTVKDLMGANGLPKGPFWDGRLPPEDPIPPLIALSDKMEHTQRRRPWTRAFNTTALKDYEPMISERVAQLVEHLGNQKGPLDIMTWFSYFTYDMMGDFAFGGGTEMMREGDKDGIWHQIESAQEIALFMSHIPWLGNMILRLSNMVPALVGDLKKFQNYAKNRAMNRKLHGSPHKDLFHHLIDEDGLSSEPPSMEQIVSDGGLAIVAGSDTTSSVMTTLFFFLLTNPKVYKRLQAEIDGLGDDVQNYTKHAHMPYLNAVINETLRLCPPVLSGSQRYAPSTTMIGPNVLPKGSTAFVHFYSLHRDPRYFSPAPDAYLPERWLSEKDRLELEPALFKDQSQFILNHDAFIPFSFGPSNCVGKNFAWMEMRMVVCSVMQKYEFKFQDGFIPRSYEESINDYFVMAKGKLLVVLSARK